MDDTTRPLVQAIMDATADTSPEATTGAPAPAGPALPCVHQLVPGRGRPRQYLFSHEALLLVGIGRGPVQGGVQ